MAVKINLPEFLKVALMFSLLIGFGSVISVVNPLISDGLTLFLSVALLIYNKKVNFNRKLLYSLLYIYILVFVSAVFTGSNIVDYFGIYLRATVILLIVTGFENDYNEIKTYFIKALWIVTYLALINFTLTLLISSYFVEITSGKSGYTVTTLGFIFNYFSTINILGFEIIRNQSIFWEPGVLQIPMNILVYYLLLEKNKKIVSALLPISVIFTTFSTTGFIILIYTLVRAYWTTLSFRNNGVVKTAIRFVFFTLLLCLMIPIIKSKFNDDEHNTSSLARQYDMLMSALIIKENPIVGIGINEENYFNEIKNKSVNIDDFLGSDEHGNTNTVVSVIIKFGIPLAIIFFYFLFNQNIFKNKWDFFILMILSLMSEPLLVVYFVILLLMSSVKLSQFRNPKQLCLIS